ncbi:MAG: hypothetical protein K9K79_11585, partial [Desulfohalobiaceae bacterium]|nr:hypothetical protein [Desulfohalobiaceae bacterium]
MNVSFTSGKADMLTHLHRVELKFSIITTTWKKFYKFMVTTFVAALPFVALRECCLYPELNRPLVALVSPWCSAC